MEIVKGVPVDMEATSQYEELVLLLENKMAGFVRIGSLGEKLRWCFRRVPRPIVSDDFIIEWNNIVSKHGEALMSPLMVVAYLRIRARYDNSGLGGFTNFLHYDHIEDASQISDKVMAIIRDLNPPNRDCVNFMFIRTTDTAAKSIGHVVLTHFLAEEGLVNIYDGAEFFRNKPIVPFLRDVIIAHHGHVPGLRAGFSQEYSVQRDEWTCAYRAIFSCLAILGRKRPEDFEIDIDQMFFIVKWAIEDNGKRLKWLSLKQIWGLVAKEKEVNEAKEKINYEILTHENDED